MGTGRKALCTCAFALLSIGCATAASDTDAPAACGELFGTSIVPLAITISPAELDTLRHNSDSHSCQVPTRSPLGCFPDTAPRAERLRCRSVTPHALIIRGPRVGMAAMEKGQKNHEERHSS